MAEQSTQQPYSEEETTKWLAWLAYHMRQRDLTIFQIEGLQPSWLTGRGAVVVHLILTRILLGVISGLIFGLINVVKNSLIFGLIFGLINGLIIGLIEFVIPIHKLDAQLRNLSRSAQNRIFIHGLIIVLAIILITSLIISPGFSLIDGPIFDLVDNPIDGLIFGLIYGLIFGIIFGYFRISRVVQRSVTSYIYTIESLQWSWENVYQNAKRGLVLSLTMGLILGLLLVTYDQVRGNLIEDIAHGLVIILIFILISGITGSIIGGAIGGFQPGPRGLVTRPNHGIWLTVHSSLKIALLAGFLASPVIWFRDNNIIDVFIYSLAAILICALWRGGLDVIEHAIIRLIIASRGHAPLNYARFLDYAANELNFLQKVGGGYVFIHRYLLEHFAEIAVERGYVDVNARRHPQSFK